MAFYQSIAIPQHSPPIILYPEFGIEQIFPRIHKVGNRHAYSLLGHIDSLYAAQPKLSIGTYHLVILWSDGADVMTDVWIYQDLLEWKDNPTVAVQNFRNLVTESGKGVTAGDGLILLGTEEKFRRTTNSLHDYLERRDVYVDEIVLPAHFYL